MRNVAKETRASYSEYGSFWISRVLNRKCESFLEEFSELSSLEYLNKLLLCAMIFWGSAKVETRCTSPFVLEGIPNRSWNFTIQCSWRFPTHLSKVLGEGGLPTMCSEFTSLCPSDRTSCIGPSNAIRFLHDLKCWNSRNFWQFCPTVVHVIFSFRCTDWERLWLERNWSRLLEFLKTSHIFLVLTKLVWYFWDTLNMGSPYLALEVLFFDHYSIQSILSRMDIQILFVDISVCGTST